MVDPTLHELVTRDMLIPITAIGLGSVIAIVAIISGMIRAVAIGRAREQTKRELAAYVAEGSLDPDKAVAMINAGRSQAEMTGSQASSRKPGGCCG